MYERQSCDARLPVKFGSDGQGDHELEEAPLSSAPSPAAEEEEDNVKEEAILAEEKLPAAGLPCMYSEEYGS